MKRLIEFCVSNTVFANVLMVLILLAGAFSGFTLIRELFPRFSLDIVLISVSYPGASPEEVEEGICLKLEDAIEGIEGVKKYETKATENVGTAIIELEENADLQSVKDEVTDAVNAIYTFPVEAERPTIRELKMTRMTIGLAIAGDLPEEQLKELGEDVKDELLALPEMSMVSLAGARKYEIAIEVSEARLRQYGLTFDEVSRAVHQASQNFPGGLVRSDQEEIQIRTMGRRYTGKDYANIVVVARPSGAVIRLDQLAEIHDGFVQDQQISLYNGKPAVMVNIFNTEDDDAIKIATAAKKYVARKNESLPKDLDGEPIVKLATYGDTAQLISARLNLLIRNGRIGLALVFLLLWIFLDLRLAFWVSLGIPISVAGALALMPAFDLSLNMITLFAFIMILGLIVDDAIIVGESIYHQRTRGRGQYDSAVAGSLRVAWPVFAAVITTIIAFTPLFFVSGIMGKFIAQLPYVAVLALAVSLIEALIILPAHLNHLPEIDRGEGSRSKLDILGGAIVGGVLSLTVPGFFEFSRGPQLLVFAAGIAGGAVVGFLLLWLRPALFNGFEYLVQKIYQPALGVCLRWRYVSLATALAVLLVTGGMYLGGLVKYQMFPEIDSNDLVASVEFPSGTPLSTTEAAVNRMLTSLRELERTSETLTGEPLIVGMLSQVGAKQNQDAGPNIGSNFGQITLEMLPTERRGHHSRAVMRQWEKLTGPIPGAVSVNFNSRRHGPAGTAIEVWLLGEDLDRVLAAAEELKEELKTLEGVFQIEDDYRPGRRELRVRIKPEAHTLGLTAADLGRQLRQGFYGDEPLRIQRGRDELRIRILYPLAQRRWLGDVNNIRIRTPQGREVPLPSVADVEIERGYASITRTDGKRRVKVMADVDNEKANADEIITNLLDPENGFIPALAARHPGLVAKVEGQKREGKESLGSLMIGFPLAMLGIFMILATIFRSYIQPTIIMFTIPFGVIGAIFGHLLMGYSLTIMSMFGIVALSGIVVNDAIVLIEQVNHYLAEGRPLRTAILDAGARRFRAVLLTSLTTIGGLMPLILEKDLQALFLIPMGLSIAAGVAFATILTLFLIPCLLYILSDLRAVAHWFFHGRLAPRESLEPATRRQQEA